MRRPSRRPTSIVLLVGRCGGFNLTAVPKVHRDVQLSTLYRVKGPPAKAVVVCEVGPREGDQLDQLTCVAMLLRPVTAGATKRGEAVYRQKAKERRRIAPPNRR